MTELHGILPNQELRSAQPTGLPTLGLLVATLAWAGSFTWAKAAGDGVNQAAGLASGALLGPILLLAWRFTAAGIFWLILDSWGSAPLVLGFSRTICRVGRAALGRTNRPDAGSGSHQ